MAGPGAGGDARDARAVAPKVSVVIPTYNRKAFLGETLATLLRQTEPSMEIIVADNSSTDDTAALVRGIADPRVQLAPLDETIPQMANWTRALGLGSGAYVALFHDDDIYEPTIVARLSALLDAHPSVGLAHAGARCFAPDGGDRGFWGASRRDFVRDGRGEALRWSRDIHDVVPSSIMLRRAVCARVGGFEPTRLYADFDFFVRVGLVSDVAFVAGPLLHVRLHDASTTSSMDPQRRVDEVNTLLLRLEAHVREAGLVSEEAWPALERRLRGRFATRLRRLELAHLAAGEPQRARAVAAAVTALDPSAKSHLLGLALRALAQRPVRPLLSAARAAWRAAGRIVARASWAR